MGGVTSRFNDTDWTKADGKLRFGNETVDGAPPSESYGVYTLTKRAAVGMGGQRDYDVTDADSNLLYTTRAVDGTIAWFDVLGRGIDEHLLRVQVDLSRRYWVVYSYGIPSFAGQLSDSFATEKASKSLKQDAGTPFLYRKACVTVSWSRFEAVAAFYGPQIVESSESEGENNFDKAMSATSMEDIEMNASVEKPGEVVEDHDSSQLRNNCAVQDEENELNQASFESLEDEKKTESCSSEPEVTTTTINDGITINGKLQPNTGPAIDAMPQNPAGRESPEKTTRSNVRVEAATVGSTPSENNESIMEDPEEKSVSGGEQGKGTKEETPSERLESGDLSSDEERSSLSRKKKFSLRKFASSFTMGSENQSDATTRTARSIRASLSFGNLKKHDKDETSREGKTLSIRNSLSYVNLRKFVQKPSAHNGADPMLGVLLSEAPVLKVQEINSLSGQHQTLLPGPGDCSQDEEEDENAFVSEDVEAGNDVDTVGTMQSDGASHDQEELGTSEITSNDKGDDQASCDEDTPKNYKNDDMTMQLEAEKEQVDSVVISDAKFDVKGHKNTSTDNIEKVEGSSCTPCTCDDAEETEQQPLVGFWSWDNTLRVHKMTMHVAKNSDLALHVVLAVITNQLRYERNAGVAAAV